MSKKKKKPEGDETLDDPIDETGADDTDEFDEGLAEAAEADPRDAEIAALKDRVAELEAAKTVVGVFPAGSRFLVRLQDAPTWVVEVQDGEHPWDAYRRVTGVVSSAHAPSITPTEEPVGRVVG